MNDSENYTFTIDDINLPHSLRRSIWLIKDEEDGNNYTADEILDDKPQDIVVNMRAIINAGYQSNEPKYVCPFCKEPVGLKIRTHEGDFFPFFSHYQDSDDSCPLKTTNEIDPSRIIITTENQFKESILHQDMVAKLKEILNLSQSFKEIEINKVISTPEVTGYRRPSLYSVYRGEEKVCFDALVSNPLIGLLVGRNAFYKMQKMFYLWVFPDFSTKYQRMSEKDILYMNKRNVFVFDSLDYYKNATDNYLGDKVPCHLFAYEESLRQKRLMLNCYWQVPIVDEKGNVSISWKGPELVAFDDIILDKNSYEAYYHDSDQDFYYSYSPEKQSLIDEWMRIKEDRWKKIFDSIEKRKILYEQALARKERRERLAYYYPLIESGEITPVAFQDEKTKLWGYKVDNFFVIPPIYYDAKPFIAGYAWVRKKSYWGMINVRQNCKYSFEYDSVTILSNGNACISKVRQRKATYWIIKKDGKKTDSFSHVSFFVNGVASAERYWNKSKIDENGEEVCETMLLNNGMYKYMSLFNDKKYGLMNSHKDKITGPYYDEIEDFVNGAARAKYNGKWGTIDENGKEVYDYIELENGFIKYILYFDGKCGLMSSLRKPITECVYSVIGDFIDGKAKVKKWNLWGVINEQGQEIIPCDYTTIEKFVDGIARAQKNNKWGIINEEGKEIIPFEYSKIGDSKNGEYIVCVESRAFNPYKSRFLYGIIGIINDKRKEIIPCIYDDIELPIDGMIKAKKNGLWGYIDEQGKTLVDFSYKILEPFNDGKAKALKELRENGHISEYWSEIDENGNEIIENTPLGEGMIKYKSRFVNKCGLMTSSGEKRTDLVFDEIEVFVDGRANASINGILGKIDVRGEEICRSEQMSNGYIKIISDIQGLCGLKNATGTTIAKCVYSIINDFKDGYALAKRGSYWGLISENGEESVPCEYSSLLVVGDRKLIAQKDGLYGIITVQNIKIVPFYYNEIGNYQKGKIRARKERMWGYVDSEGGRGISFVYDYAKDFVDGKAICSKDDYWGVINERGQEVVPFDYNEISDCSNGMVIAQDDYGWGIIDYKGTPVVPFEYDELYSFVQGKARARKDEVWGFINIKGETVIPFKYYELEDFKDGKARATLDGEGYIDEKGNEIIEHYRLSNGLIKEVAPLSCKCRLLNPEGSEVTDKVFSEIKEFVDGKAIAAVGSSITEVGKWGLIDENGNELIPLEYDSIAYLGSGKYCVEIVMKSGWQRERKCRLLNSDGSEVTKKLFRTICKFVDGKAMAAAYNTRKWGVIDENGKELIPCEYGSITRLSPEKYEVVKDIGSRRHRSQNDKQIINFANSEIEFVEVKSNSKIDILKLNSEEVYHAIVIGKINMGVFVKIPLIGKGLIPKKEIVKAGKSMKDFRKGDNVDVMLHRINTEKQQATFKLVNNKGADNS